MWKKTGAILISLGIFISSSPSVLLSPLPNTLSASTFISKQKNNSFLETVRAHYKSAAQILDFSDLFLRRLLTPERIIAVEIPVQMDNGNMRIFKAWRVQHSFILGAGKGGIRVKPGLTQQDVQALAMEMTIKNALAGLPLGGAKGGIDADPSKLSEAEFARLMRGYVSAVMNAVWEKYEDIAFNIFTDVPAPDVGTNPKLMHICVDELLGWLLTHQQQYTQWLHKHLNGQADSCRIPLEMIPLAGSNGSDEHTVYLETYCKLRKAGIISDLNLIGAFTGKAPSLGGSLGRATSTGLGVAYSALETLKHDGKLPPEAERFSKKTTVAVQGFGNVGMGAVKAFTQLGAKVVAITEWDPVQKKPYAIYCSNGFTEIEILALEEFRKKNKTLKGFPDTRELAIEDFWRLDVAILAPCVGENEITQEVAQIIQAPYVVEGANGPTTPEADLILYHKGVQVIPDVFANAGGVIVSFFEMEQNRLGVSWSEEEVNQKLYKKIRDNHRDLVTTAKTNKVSLRKAALLLALSRIKEEVQNKLLRGDYFPLDHETGQVAIESAA